MKYGLVGKMHDGYHFDIDDAKLLIIDKSAFFDDEWDDIHLLLDNMQNWVSQPDYFKNYIQGAVKNYAITQQQADKIIKNTSFYLLTDILKKANIRYS